MEREEEILLEQFIRSKNMNSNERDFCIYLLRNTKEVSESDVVLNSKSESAFDIVTIDLEKKDGVIFFNGAIANDQEYKWIDGIISKKNNKYVVASNIYRLYELLDDDQRDYTSLDIFTFKDNCVKRTTNYIPVRNYFEAEVDEYNEMELYEYYLNKIHGNQMKKDLK